MTFPSITIQGNIISTEILDKISREEIDFQRNIDFGLTKESKVRDEIGLAYALARGYWNGFRLKLERLSDREPGTTETRNLWMIPFLTELGYTVEKAGQESINGKSYAISHRAQNLNKFPIHIVGFRQDLDRKDDFTQTRISSHGLVQEYLNVTDDHLYAIITNGRFLRILRDSSRLAKLSYVEFNLEKIFEEDLFSDFAVLYRLIHASRMAHHSGDGEKSIMEQYHQLALDSGNRIRENLRMEVKNSLKVLGSGFLNSRLNREFAEAVFDDKIVAKPYFDTLLRTIYRLLFLIVTEERKLIYPEGEKDSRNRKIYFEFYSIERLRRLSNKRQFVEKDKYDLWEGLKSTFKLFETNGYGKPLGIAPLGGDLFSETALQFNGFSLHELKLSNNDLLQVIANLTLTRNQTGIVSRVNYSDLDVEELGSVYEGLLELHPVFYTESTSPSFGFTEGSERKLTGSYYTRHDLVAQLIKTSLIPLIEERLQGITDAAAKEKVILDIKVCDPATGSGHFLLAAARILAYYLAVVRSGEENPGEKWMAQAKRDVIQRCIYGVDLNPAAVELCRLALWIEGHNSGKPLSFLEHKIKNGNALVGVDRLELLTDGIPDGAFDGIVGDDKETVKAEKKTNAEFRKKKQFSLFMGRTHFGDDLHRFAESNRAIDAIRGDSLSEVEQQKKRYEISRSNHGWMKTLTACNLYTYAFYQSYTKDQKHFSNSEFLAQYLQSAGSLNAHLEGKAFSQYSNSKFFHWALEYPEVIEKGGFDLILANPPWEIVELKEKEFFENRAPEIAEADSKAKRTKLIERLKLTDPDLYNEYEASLKEINCSRKFISGSGVFTLTNRGRANLYSLFSEKILRNINPKGGAGFIVPTGIATDDGNKEYFSHLIESGRLISLFDFENKKGIFPNVHRSFKFSLISLGKKLIGRKAVFGFFLHDILDIQDKERVFALGQKDFCNINPNTKTTPILRTRKDSEIVSNIYSRIPVLVDERKNQNNWMVSFKQGLYNMSTDSGNFKTSDQLFNLGFTLKANRFIKNNELWVPLYESKMIWQFDHRYGDYSNFTNFSSSHLPNPEIDSMVDFSFCVLPRYWVKLEHDFNSLLVYRFSTGPTNERTIVGTILSKVATNHILPIIIPISIIDEVVILSNLNSLILDYIARNKMGRQGLDLFFLKQFPFIPKKSLQNSVLEKIVCLTVELIYTTYELKIVVDKIWVIASAELRKLISCLWDNNQSVTGGGIWMNPDWKDAYPEIEWERENGCPLPPFKWDEERRAKLKAELDAYFAMLYGLERDELRYILDPQDVYGEDFPGETFRVLKEKDIRRYGEYRTRRLVLEAYDRLLPDWDMEAHFQRLKEIWEECQVDLTPKPSLQVNEPKASYGKKKSEKDLGMKGLFD